MARILYFGRVSDLTGCDSEQVDLPETVTSIAALRNWADARFSTQGAFQDPTVRIAIDSEIVTEADVLNQPIEVAFLPPVGGG